MLDPDNTKLILRQVYAEPDDEDTVTFQVHHYPDADVIIRFKPPEPGPDTSPITTATPITYTLLIVLLTAMLLPIASILLQLYILTHPLTATVTILTSQQVSFPGIRSLPQITLGKSQTGAATGNGHENARAATGTLTFYNGLFTPQLIIQGEVFTGSDGVQVMTDAGAGIPAANPPSFSIVSVLAHAVVPGTSGNIAAGDIDTTISNGVLVKNLGSFYGGKNARNYHVITKDDINKLSTVIQASISTSLSLPYDSQLQFGEVLTTPSCSPVVTSDHQVGQEATRVQVTVKETCKASAYSLERVKHFLAGKDTQYVMRLFKASGQVAISFNGVGDSSRLPRENFIHLVFIVQ